MTPDDILNMPAGEDIDAMVHRVVFGNKVDKIVLVEDPSKYYYSSKTEIKHYSTDIAAAWEVVEKIHLMVRPSVLSGQWVAMKFERVYLSGKWEGVGEVTSDTAPLAICRAALLAVMEA